MRSRASRRRDLRRCVAPRRLVPLGSDKGAGLARPPQPTGAPVDTSQPTVVRESEDLRATTLAFILGKRSQGSNEQMTMVDAAGDEVIQGALDKFAFGYSYGVNAGIAPGMPGTERFQKLCSLPYLQRYFTNALWNKGICLAATGDVYANVGREGGAFGDGSDTAWSGTNGDPIGGSVASKALFAGKSFASGLPRAAVAAYRVRALDMASDVVPGPNLPAMFAESSLTKMADIAKFMCLPGADGLDPMKTPRIHQGIFARDFGPFLRGKGITQDMISGTPGSNGGQPVALRAGVGAPSGPYPPRTVQPYQVSRCAGDELAFALFEQLLEEKGLTDWRPDGIVLSKGVNDPSDKLSDEYLEARDGQLFNMRIQGPAIATSWTGDPALEVMPLDKVFVVIVADVWWGGDAALPA